MKRRSPSVALIWMYQGKDVDARRGMVEAFDYPDFTVIEVSGGAWTSAIRAVPDQAEVCVFWMDDDKPIARNFLKQMTQPLIAGEDLRAVMHFWSGNAISLPKELLDATSIEDDHSSVQSLLKLLLPVLDAVEKPAHGRVHLAFSSTERLAPLSMDPVGFPS